MVSIVIPVYNVQDYLEECICSVLKLKTEMEIILVDDGSTDNSGKLCDEWGRKDARIRVIHQPNGGLSAARNAGIRAAEGAYIMFLDSDDFIDPEETDRMLSHVNGNTEIILGLYREYYADTGAYREENCNGFLTISGCVSIEEFLNVIPKDGQECYMIAPRFVVKREFIHQNNLFFLQNIYHEDEEWTGRLLCCANRICVTHCYFYQYRQARAGAITSKVSPKNIWDRFTIMEHMHGQIQKLGSNQNKTQYLKQRMGQLYLSNVLDSRVLSKEEWAVAEKYFKKYSFCASAMTGTVGSVIKTSNFLLGIKATSFLLKIAYKIFK